MTRSKPGEVYRALQHRLDLRSAGSTAYTTSSSLASYVEDYLIALDIGKIDEAQRALLNLRLCVMPVTAVVTTKEITDTLVNIETEPKTTSRWQDSVWRTVDRDIARDKAWWRRAWRWLRGEP